MFNREVVAHAKLRGENRHDERPAEPLGVLRSATVKHLRPSEDAKAGIFDPDSESQSHQSGWAEAEAEKQCWRPDLVRIGFGPSWSETAVRSEFCWHSLVSQQHNRN